MSKGDSSPLMDDTLQILFELFHAPLLDPGTGSNMMFDIDKLIPKNPVFDIVASQRIQIQNNCWSDFHEYFPVICY